MFFHRKKYADSKHSGLAPTQAESGGEQLGQVIGAMPAGGLCIQARGDSHSGVLLAVEQCWGHFQTPSPNFQHVTPLSRVRVPGQMGGLTPGQCLGAVWGGSGCGAVLGARYRAAVGTSVSTPAVQCPALLLAGDQGMPAVPLQCHG